MCPALVQMPQQSAVQHETFAPILCVLRYDDTDMAIVRCRNVCPRVCSSAIFTQSLTDAERLCPLRVQRPQRQHRHLGRRDRWRLRWREGNHGGREMGSDA